MISIFRNILTEIREKMKEFHIYSAKGYQNESETQTNCKPKALEFRIIL